MSSDRHRPDPGDFPPREAVERWLDQRRTDHADSSIQSYWYRLKLWVEYCEGNGIERVGDLTGWDFEEYERLRRREGVAATTLKNEKQSLKKWVEYLERIDAVEDGLAEKVHVPDPPKGERSDDTLLLPEDALALIEHYRNDQAAYGTLRHTFLELAWFTGARLGGLRGLDVRDYDSDEGYVEFVHRPDTGTPLKNKLDGQRPVSLPREVCDVVDRYIEYHRLDKLDDEGRQPLLAGQRGRPEPGTIRTWAYRATFPCHYRDCPHGQDPEVCEYKDHGHHSKCPSSRSPHPIRTGSITWQRDLGFPPEVVAERVNSSIEVIEEHYDKQSAFDRMKTRRQQYVERMNFDQNHDSE